MKFLILCLILLLPILGTEDCDGWLLCNDGEIGEFPFIRADLSSFITSAPKRRWRRGGYITPPNKFLLHTMGASTGPCSTFVDPDCWERHVGADHINTLYRSGGIFPHFIIARNHSGSILIGQVLSFERPCVAIDRWKGSALGTVQIEIQGPMVPPLTSNEEISRAVATLWAALNKTLNIPLECEIPFFDPHIARNESNRVCSGDYPTGRFFVVDGKRKPYQYGLDRERWRDITGLIGHQHACGKCRTQDNCHAITHGDPGPIDCELLKTMAEESLRTIHYETIRSQVDKIVLRGA